MKKLALLLSVLFFLFGQANSQDYSLKNKVLENKKSVYKAIKSKEKISVLVNGTKYGITEKKKEFFGFVGGGETVSFSLGEKDKSVSESKRWEAFWISYIPQYTDFMKGWILYYNGEYYVTDSLNGSIIQGFDNSLKYRKATQEEAEKLRNIAIAIINSALIQ